MEFVETYRGIDINKETIEGRTSYVFDQKRCFKIDKAKTSIDDIIYSLKFRSEPILIGKSEGTFVTNRGYNTYTQGDYYSFVSDMTYNMSPIAGREAHQLIII